MNSLPSQFESFAQARKDGFLAAKEVKDSGRKMVGTFCCFTPSELPIAAKAVPVGVCGVSEEAIPEAEKILPRNLCPLIKSSYGHVITDTCPYFSFSNTSFSKMISSFQRLNSCFPLALLGICITWVGFTFSNSSYIFFLPSQVVSPISKSEK